MSNALLSNHLLVHIPKFLAGNPFTSIDQLVERQTSNPRVRILIPAPYTQNLCKKISRVGYFHLWLFGTLDSYIKDLIVFCFGNGFVFKSILACCGKGDDSNIRFENDTLGFYTFSLHF